MTEPMPAPGSPLPGLTVPDMSDDWQFTTLPVFVSFSAVAPRLGHDAPARAHGPGPRRGPGR